MNLQNGIDNGKVPFVFKDMTLITPLFTPPQLGFNFLQEGTIGSISLIEGRVKNDEENIIGKKNGNPKLCSRGHWRPHEDSKLKELVAQFGPQNWNIIAEKFEGRSGKSCRLRWFNQLDPRINRGAFSEEEEERLLSAHKMYGNKWSLITRLFPGRTDNAVKNHWHVIMARRYREHNSVYRRRKPCFSQVQIKGISVISNPNSCNGSSSSSNVDESGASTRTDLSLTPSSVKVPHFLSRFSLFHQQNLIGNDAVEKKVKDVGRATNEVKVGDNGKWAMAAANNPDNQQSDSNYSDVSAASESVANNNRRRANLYTCGEENVNNLPFIDFLGVGVNLEW